MSLPGSARGEMFAAVDKQAYPDLPKTLRKRYPLKGAPQHVPQGVDVSFGKVPRPTCARFSAYRVLRSNRHPF